MSVRDIFRTDKELAFHVQFDPEFNKAADDMEKNPADELFILIALLKEKQKNLDFLKQAMYELCDKLEKAAGLKKEDKPNV